MKKKVIFVSEALWIGGIETALINLLNHLDHERFDVTLLISKASLEMADKVNRNCRLIVADREKDCSFEKPYRFARLYHLTEKTDHPSKLHRAMMWMTPLIRWIENRLYIGYVRKNMRGEHFDTAVIYSDRTAELTVRGIRADRYLMYYHHGAMRREYHDEIGYRKSYRIIAVSKGIADKLADFRPKYREKIIHIRNLVDTDNVMKRSTETVAEEFDQKLYHIVTVGRVSFEKGIDIAAHACALLVSKGHTGFRWWIVGDGPSINEIKELQKKLNIERYLKLVGMKENPYPYVSKADIYVQPSRIESFGLTIAEAMALCKPIVATRTVGAMEVLSNYANGKLCGFTEDELALIIEKGMIGSKTQLFKEDSINNQDELNRTALNELMAIL